MARGCALNVFYKLIRCTVMNEDDCVEITKRVVSVLSVGQFTHSLKTARRVECTTANINACVKKYYFTLKPNKNHI